MATDAAIGTAGDATGRELFWRRLLAGAIDIALLVVLAQVAALVLYAASDGKLRSSTLLKSTQCAPVQGISYKVLQGVAIPPGARPVAGQLCKVSMGGMETARFVTVALQAQEGELVRSLAFSRPVNRKAEPVAPFVMDWIYPLAAILLAGLVEGALGATPGKRFLGLKVTRPDGHKLGPGRAILRNLVIYGGAALVLIVPLAAAFLHIRLPPLGYYTAVGVFGLLILAPFAMLAEASPRAAYDRWLGADVVRA